MASRNGPSNNRTCDSGKGSAANRTACPVESAGLVVVVGCANATPAASKDATVSNGIFMVAIRSGVEDAYSVSITRSAVFFKLGSGEIQNGALSHAFGKMLVLKFKRTGSNRCDDWHIAGNILI